MTDRNMTREELIEWLDNAIDVETQKPTDEIDIEFVNECEQLINVLMGNYHEYTDEEAEQYFAEIEKRKQAKKNTYFIRSKKILAASVAVLIIFLGGVTVYASSPIVRDFINKTLHLNVGQSLEQDGITYIHAGKTTEYGSIEEFIKTESLNIKYPKYFPYNASVKTITFIESDNGIYFTFNDDRIHFSIHKNANLSEGLIKYAEKINTDFHVFYINSRATGFAAYSVMNEYLYILQCDSQEELLETIKSID